MDFPIERVGEAILFLIALVLSITVHEFGHAWVATKLGDTLPRAQGRLTLSPASHVDPIGTLLFPLIMFFTSFSLLGWGRPVQTNPSAYTRRFSRSTGSMFVALAGPGMNFLLATIVSVVLMIAFRFHLLQEHHATLIIRNFVMLNVTLMIFNLLPIPPLDGGAVLAWFLPRSLQYVIDFLQRWGFIILLGLVMIPGVLSTLMAPGYYLAGLWLQLLGAIFR